MNKDNKTLQITTGAMFIAIFAAILIINRQTGGMLEEFFMYILPIPMVAFTAKFGWKPGIPVLVGMTFFAFIFGSPLTIFYAVSEALIGLVMGGCIHKKVESTKTMFIVMVMSAVANVLNTIVFASLFGFDLDRDIREMQTMMHTALEKAAEMSGTAVNFPEHLLTTASLMRIMVISMTLLGIIQGVLVYMLSLLILNRLQFKIEKPKSLYSIYPPKWTGYICITLYCVFTLSGMWLKPGDQYYTYLETIGLCAYLYLVIFGYMGLMLYLRVRHSLGKLFTFLLASFLFLTVPPLLMLAGFVYITGDLHKKLMDVKEGKYATSQASAGSAGAGSAARKDNRSEAAKELAAKQARARQERQGSNPPAAKQSKNISKWANKRYDDL